MPAAATPFLHVFVGRYSLPVPLGLILAAAVLVVAVSFLLLYLAPPAIHDDEDSAEPEAPAWLVRGLTGFWSVLIAFIVLEALFGRQDQLLFNPGAVLFWIWALPLVPVLHCLAGGLYGASNPFAALTGRISSRPRLAAAEVILKRLGYWPALVQLLVIIWGESVQVVAQSPRVLGVLALLYVVIQVAGGLLLGRGWYRGGDVFQAVTELASTVAPVGLRRDAGGVVRFVKGFNPSRSLPWRPGREALITLWLAGVLADGLRQLPAWRAVIAPGLTSLIQSVDNSMGVDAEDAVTITVEIAVAWVAFSYFFWFFSILAAWLSSGGARDGLSRRINRVSDAVAPSLIPIALAYLLAHNLTQILVVGPMIVTTFGRPVSDLPRLYQDQLRFVSAAWVWWLQVAAIVAGHVIAVMMAHARLARAIEAGTGPAAGRRAALRADLGWLTAMLLYTATSLWIIAQPITA